MSGGYDAIVVGAGPAGEVCAGELADGGMRVAIVERELVAGECSYWACMPSKTLLRPGEALAAARAAPGAREAVDGGLDPSPALAWRNWVVSDWDDAGQIPWLEEKGIELLRGDARIVAPGTVEVDGTAHEAERIVIATGSEPVFPPIDGLDGLEGVWTNREVTALKQVPKSIVMIGGGPVGVEMGQALIRLGAEVTVIESSERLLSKEAPAVGEALAEALAEEGIELRFGAKAEEVQRRDAGYVVTIGDEELSAEKLLIATGRTPRLDVGLEAVGIEPGERGIEVDDRLRAADGVWAIGDVTGIMPFTHVGKYQARIAAKDMLGIPGPAADYRAVPRVIFTDPQVAAVGEPEGEATGTAPLSSLARTSTYARNGEARGFLSLVSDGSKLIGAYAVGPEAGDWLQQATLAIRADVPVELLREVIQPFPTFSEAFPSALADLDSR